MWNDDGSHILLANAVTTCVICSPSTISLSCFFWKCLLMSERLFDMKSHILTSHTYNLIPTLCTFFICAVLSRPRLKRCGQPATSQLLHVTPMPCLSRKCRRSSPFVLNLPHSLKVSISRIVKNESSVTRKSATMLDEMYIDKKWVNKYATYFLLGIHATQRSPSAGHVNDLSSDLWFSTCGHTPRRCNSTIPRQCCGLVAGGLCIHPLFWTFSNN